MHIGTHLSTVKEPVALVSVQSNETLKFWIVVQQRMVPWTRDLILGGAAQITFFHFPLAEPEIKNNKHFPNTQLILES